MCRLYGEPNCIHFKDACVHIVHIVITIGVFFDWVAIPSHSLNRAINRDKKYKSKNFPTFYMESYPLDMICANNPFLDMNLNWNIVKTPIHVYC
jgi:hypothetical protein